jgi:hypothetical protein
MLGDRYSEIIFNMKGVRVASIDNTKLRFGCTVCISGQVSTLRVLHLFPETTLCLPYNTRSHSLYRGMWWCGFLKHYATSQKVTDTMRLLDFSIDLIHPAAPWPWG